MLNNEVTNQTEATRGTEANARPRLVITSIDHVIRLMTTCENLMKFSQAQRVKSKSGETQWDEIIDAARLVHAGLIAISAPISLMELAGMRLAIQNTAADLGAEVGLEEAEIAKIIH